LLDSNPSFFFGKDASLDIQIRFHTQEWLASPMTRTATATTTFHVKKG